MDPTHIDESNAHNNAAQRLKPNQRPLKETLKVIYPKSD